MKSTYFMPGWLHLAHCYVVRWAVYRPHPGAPFSVWRRRSLGAWLGLLRLLSHVGVWGR
jgi:hypothetical protein